MEEISINILVEAKTEYTKQLTNTLVPYLYEGIESIYDDSSELANTENNEEISTLRMFQNLLKRVPKWNQDLIDREIQRILDRSQCVWLPDLIAAVFVSNTKILTAVRVVSSKKKINLTIPKVAHFIHKCYIECAREFYKNPFLMDKDTSNTSNTDRQRNLRESMKIIEECVCDAVRKLLPFQEILKQYLGESFADNEDDITDNKYLKTPVKKSKLNQYLTDSDSESEYTEEEVEVTDSEDDEGDKERENIMDMLKKVKGDGGAFPDVNFIDTKLNKSEDLIEQNQDGQIDQIKDKKEDPIIEQNQDLIVKNINEDPEKKEIIIKQENSSSESDDEEDNINIDIPVRDSGIKKIIEKSIKPEILSTHEVLSTEKPKNEVLSSQEINTNQQVIPINIEEPTKIEVKLEEPIQTEIQPKIQTEIQPKIQSEIHPEIEEIKLEIKNEVKTEEDPKTEKEIKHVVLHDNNLSGIKKKKIIIRRKVKKPKGEERRMLFADAEDGE